MNEGRTSRNACRPVRAAAGLAVAAALLTGVPAMAAQHSFEGSCAIVGVATFPPMGLAPAPPGYGHFSYEGEGRCMGTLDGRRLPQAGVPVRVLSTGPKPGHSCELGFDPGARWALTFYPRPSSGHAARRARARGARPVTIVGTMDVVDGLRGQVIALRGETSGLALDHGQGQGHAETLSDCARGELETGVMTGQLDTVTPLVS